MTDDNVSDDPDFVEGMIAAVEQALGHYLAERGMMLGPFVATVSFLADDGDHAWADLVPADQLTRDTRSLLTEMVDRQNYLAWARNRAMYGDDGPVDTGWEPQG